MNGVRPDHNQPNQNTETPPGSASVETRDSDRFPVLPDPELDHTLASTRNRAEYPLRHVVIPNPVTQMPADLEGLNAATGLVIGRAVVIPSAEIAEDERRTISKNQIDVEIQKLNTALTNLEQECKKNAGGLDFMQEFIRDIKRRILPITENLVRNARFSAAVAVNLSFEAAISDMPTEEFKNEVKALRDTWIANIHDGRKELDLSNLEPETVIVGYNFTASNLAPIGPHSNIIGMVSDIGGRTGHAVITANSNGWAAVTATEEATADIKTGDTVIVDGATGKVWVNPSPGIIAWYEREKEHRIPTDKLIPVESNCVQTADGSHSVFISCNADTLMEVEQMKRVFPEGMRTLRLVRTEAELLYEDLERKPIVRDEEKQFAFYRQVLEACPNNGVTFRTVDWGGEKSLTGHRVDNPALGARGLRQSLMDRDLFKIQVRAILRSTKCGKVRMMVPMVTDGEEISELKEFIDTVARELEEQGYSIDLSRFKLGVMIEVPAAVDELDKILPQVDFVSVGSNDLTQYVLASDRLHTAGDKEGKWEKRYGPHHPAVLKRLEEIFRKTKEHGKDASICGEMAANPFYLPIALGLGVKHLSLRPRGAEAVIDTISGLDCRDCKYIVDRMIASSGPEESLEILKIFFHLITERPLYEPDEKTASLMNRIRTELPSMQDSLNAV